MAQPDWREITVALTAAVTDRGLPVLAEPDLNGARVTGRRADVYLVPTATGINVECWRKLGRHPYKIVSTDELDDAVQLAVAEM